MISTSRRPIPTLLVLFHSALFHEPKQRGADRCYLGLLRREPELLNDVPRRVGVTVGQQPNDVGREPNRSKENTMSKKTKIQPKKSAKKIALAKEAITAPEPLAAAAARAVPDARLPPPDTLLQKLDHQHHSRALYHHVGSPVAANQQLQLSIRPSRHHGSKRQWASSSLHLLEINGNPFYSRFEFLAS
jgi:hypothetical protein